MKKIPAKKWISAVVIFIFFYPAYLWSAHREVTLFPDSAQVIGVTKVKIQAESKDSRKAILILPGQADPNFLVVSLSRDSKIKIEEIAWHQIVQQDDEKIADIRKQLDKLKDERKHLLRNLDLPAGQKKSILTSVRI